MSFLHVTSRSFWRITQAAIAVLFSLALAVPAQAADRARLEAFLEVTGFDVALESIRLSADSAPQMLGMRPEDFGSEWSRLVGDVFASEIMHEMALEILGETLSDELLNHGASFYADDLGKRLVAAENQSHMLEDGAGKDETGAQILEGLESIGSSRVALLQRLNEASGSEDSSVRAIQEVQVRFLMAAASAGVIELQMEEADLREMLRSREGSMRASIRASAMSGAAYTYQAFSDAEVAQYAEALEDPRMKEVYALMNAVQFEIMANRYEAVAIRLKSMQPSQEL
ncbi:hypothetical protein C1J03_11205 [Sulfitobacter sp. SK012]|uniref:DUF2059 domain-containing protein n=1 Tax=Sulfitobacter sp. SK012 TaxID=1389005 RepID=UPI000E0C88AB|nr:DUF2059 domain-containing protein [Sulfitobacter sp. SK012]AXI46534.1 hypothetical protein C1J03_11205 [Sulfitobacter sp. SK012]